MTWENVGSMQRVHELCTGETMTSKEFERRPVGRNTELLDEEGEEGSLLVRHSGALEVLLRILASILTAVGSYQRGFKVCVGRAQGQIYFEMIALISG